MTNTTETIEIPFSKKKLILLLIGAIGFVAIGLWLVIQAPDIDHPFLGNPTVILATGIASILFFGLCAVYIARKLTDDRPGLVLDELGLTDNSSGVSAGQILWRDIEAISVIKFQRQKFILLQVKNPQDYIDRQTNGLNRKMMQMNFNLYGTPLSITANALQIKFDTLLNLLHDHLGDSR